MKCTNFAKQSTSGFLSVLVFLLALPVWLLVLFLYLSMSLLQRVMSLLLRRPEKQRPMPLAFTRAPDISSKKKLRNKYQKMNGMTF